jgi:FAD/FMN-containing dehydrogenase
MRDLIADLRAISGAEHVLTDPGVMAGYVTDWTRRYSGTASCVVLPGSAAQTARVLRCCAGHGVPVVPQGGNTSLVGGSVPPPARSSGRAPVVLSTRRLTGLRPVDALAGQVTAGAGVTIGQLRVHAAAAGLAYGVDLASRDSATVGGTIATNAGGIAAIRYGPTRSQLLGVSAVLADGSVISNLSGLAAGTTGYDLAQLLAGSEGTLAVITAARLRLWPAEPVAAVLLSGVAGIAAAAELCSRLRAAVPGLRAAEYVDAAGLDLVCQVTGLPAPLPTVHRGYLLAEIGGAGNGGTALDTKRLARADLPSDTAIAQDGRGQVALWAYRERVTEAIASCGIPHKIDVAVPSGALGAFRAELDQVVLAAAGLPGPRGVRDSGTAGTAGTAGPAGMGRAGDPAVIVFGHIGVGNLHVNVLGPDPADTAVDVAVARLAAAHGGSAAAEHGVGRAKTGWLRWSRSPAEIAVMRAIKTALDPAGLLNPGVLLPPAAFLHRDSAW